MVLSSLVDSIEAMAESIGEGSSDNNDEDSEPDSPLKNGVKEKRRAQYPCPFEGCGKVYRKPCLLRDHQRSHTGEVNTTEFNVLDDLGLIDLYSASVQVLIPEM